MPTGGLSQHRGRRALMAFRHPECPDHGFVRRLGRGGRRSGFVNTREIIWEAGRKPAGAPSSLAFKGATLHVPLEQIRVLENRLGRNIDPAKLL